MKLFVTVISFFIVSSILLAQENQSISFVIQNNFGYTFVDVADAVGADDYDEVTQSGLVEWEQFNYNGSVQLLFNMNKPMAYGAEIGVNRLYYWEEKYTPFGFDPRWNWGTVWTLHIGGVLRFNLSPNTYFLTGLAAQIFLDESGTTAGIPAAFGYEFKLSDTISLPWEFRADIIFAKATTIGFGSGIGFRFDL